LLVADGVARTGCRTSNGEWYWQSQGSPFFQAMSMSEESCQGWVSFEAVHVPRGDTGCAEGSQGRERHLIERHLPRSGLHLKGRRLVYLRVRGGFVIQDLRGGERERESMCVYVCACVRAVDADAGACARYETRAAPYEPGAENKWDGDRKLTVGGSGLTGSNCGRQKKRIARAQPGGEFMATRGSGYRLMRMD